MPRCAYRTCCDSLQVSVFQSCKSQSCTFSPLFFSSATRLYTEVYARLLLFHVILVILPACCHSCGDNGNEDVRINYMKRRCSPSQRCTDARHLYINKLRAARQAAIVYRYTTQRCRVDESINNGCLSCSS